jgi:hypothetical protein
MRTIALLALIASCGDDGNGSGLDAKVPDASVPDSSGPPDAPDASPQTPQGLFVIIESPTPGVTTWFAEFGTDLDIVVSSRDDGPCRVQRTMRTTNPRVSAGTLSVTGGTASAVTMSFRSSGYSHYASSLVYAAGDQLTLAASGATVPAFSTQLAFPSSLTLTSTAPTELSMSGFTATWNTTTSDVYFEISQFRSGEPAVVLICTFDGTVGTGSVPASALTDFVTSAPAGIGISTRTRQPVTAGVYDVDVLAAYVGLASSNVPVVP